MIRLSALLCLVLPVAALAEDKKPDAAAMKGKWKLASARFNGKDSATGTDGQKGFVIAEKDITTFDGKKTGRTLTYTLDPKADPKRIDLALVGTDQKSKGIYKLDGDTLTICYGEPGADRPAKMESKEGGKTFLLVLKRVKD